MNAKSADKIATAVIYMIAGIVALILIAMLAVNQLWLLALHVGK